MIVEFDAIPFHEATVRDFAGAPGKVTIAVEIEIEPTPAGFQRGDVIRVDFVGATDLTRDQAPSPSFRKEASDGEVLSLSYSRGYAEILIEWCEYNPPRTQTFSYRFASQLPSAVRVTGRGATYATSV